jgi:hypothetical protein
MRLTALSVFFHRRCELTAVSFRDILDLEGSARCRVSCTKARIARGHGTLERIALPSEQVVTMLPESSAKYSDVVSYDIDKHFSFALPITHTKDEGVLSGISPHVIELSGVPCDFVENFRNTDGVGGGACSAV